MQAIPAPVETPAFLETQSQTAAVEVPLAAEREAAATLMSFAQKRAEEECEAARAAAILVSCAPTRLKRKRAEVEAGTALLVKENGGEQPRRSSTWEKKKKPKRRAHPSFGEAPAPAPAPRPFAMIGNGSSNDHDTPAPVPATYGESTPASTRRPRLVLHLSPPPTSNTTRER
jgi:hypothetical protein